MTTLFCLMLVGVIAALTHLYIMARVLISGLRDRLAKQERELRDLRAAYAGLTTPLARHPGRDFEE